MVGGNCTEVTEFILKGFTDHPDIQVLLFMVFLVIYIITLLGNLGMIMIDPRLHTPMYYFLGNLAFVDLCYATVIAPKMLVDLLAERKSASYPVTMTLRDLHS
uniref:G-protein coupled receptors family 1 profile domain-containing protein n=1 Tax=Gopherus agassizii TaxID=38772 RepID=A0A452H1L8_9SAUR